MYAFKDPFPYAYVLILVINTSQFNPYILILQLLFIQS